MEVLWNSSLRLIEIQLSSQLSLLYITQIFNLEDISNENALLNLISQQDDINKIYLYAKDLSEPKYEFLIKEREDLGIKHFNYSYAFIECSNTIDDVYDNIDYYNPKGKRKILIVFDDIIADFMSNKKFQVVY